MTQVDVKEQLASVIPKLDTEPQPKIVGYLDMGSGPELNWLELDDLFHKKLPEELSNPRAFIAIPDISISGNSLSDLYRQTQNIPTRDRLKEIDAKERLANALNTILDTHGFRQVLGFSGIHDILIAGYKYPQFGSMIIVPVGDRWIELPPGVYDLSIAKKIQAGEPPAGAKNIKDFQKRSMVLQFDRESIGQYPRSGFGFSYMEATRFVRHFDLFYDGTPGKRKEWVVLRTPEAVKEYIKQRFNGNLDLKTGNLIVANDQKGAIIGKKDEFYKRHIERLQDILKKKIHFN